jgi:hypothetical protein
MSNQRFTHQITCIYCLDAIFIDQYNTYKLTDGWRIGINKNAWGKGVCPKCDKTLKEREKALDELTKQAQDLDMGY